MKNSKSFVSFASSIRLSNSTASAYHTIKEACKLAGHASYSDDAEVVINLLELDGGEEAVVAVAVARAYLSGGDGQVAVEAALKENAENERAQRKAERRYFIG